MTPEEAVEVIRHQHHAVMATTRSSDGGVQLSPVAVVVDDDGTLVVSSREPAMKVRNLRRTPYSAVCVFPDTFFGGQWVQVEGPTRIEPMPDALEGLVKYYRNLVGEHPDWDEYRAAMVTEQRVLLRITVERAGPTTLG
jgi:PPOX class probable F420-dependent enzyme